MPVRELVLCDVALLSPEVHGAAPWKLKQFQGTLTVRGEGRVLASPDIARVTIGVQTQAEKATQALSENNKRMRSVLDAIKAAEVAPGDVQTVALGVYPVTERTSDRRVRRYYRVVNTVRVTVRQLDRLGTLLDAVVEAGANQVSGIQFDVSDRKKLEDEARQLAVANARHKAELLAEAAGDVLCRALQINEAGAITPVPIMLEARKAAAGSVPIAAGELEIVAAVTVMYLVTRRFGR